MKQVDIVYFEASSGHKSAAEALRFGLQTEHPDWNIRCVDLGDILKCQTRLLSLIYSVGINFFNWCMRRERYFCFQTGMKLAIIFAKINTQWRSLRFLLRWTSEFWADSVPDAVISVTPMMHTIAYEAARIVNPQVYCITIPVDFSEMTPGYWYQPEIKQQYLIGCDGLHKEAVASGVSPQDIVRLSGMIIDPRFYSTATIDKPSFFKDLKLDPALPTGVISFGGQGTVNVMRCAAAIVNRKIAVNLVCLCGKNAGLLKAVSELQSDYPIVAKGFTEEPPVDVLRVADFLIGKPGTMTLTEALVTETAFVFVESKGLKIVQGANEDWVLQQGIGMQADTPDHVGNAVLDVIDNPSMRKQITACYHRGIFDSIAAITDIVCPIAECSAAAEKAATSAG